MSLKPCIPVSDAKKKWILETEWNQHVKKIKNTPVKDPMQRYDGLGRVGKILKEYLLRENKVRTKAMENPNILAFLKKFIQIGKIRAKELGYKYEDIEVTADSGISPDGKLLINFRAKDGAVRIKV